jgi:hypothetical protein
MQKIPFHLETSGHARVSRYLSPWQNRALRQRRDAEEVVA